MVRPGDCKPSFSMCKLAVTGGSFALCIESLGQLTILAPVKRGGLISKKVIIIYKLTMTNLVLKKFNYE